MEDNDQAQEDEAWARIYDVGSVPTASQILHKMLLRIESACKIRKAAARALSDIPAYPAYSYILQLPVCT